MDRRVLLIEDNPLDQLLAATILRKNGYVVKIVDDGRDALERVAGGEVFDIILVDYELPTLNGIEVTYELRLLGFRRSIVAVSAGSEAELISDWRDAGCCDFLAKPYLPRQLRELVNQTLIRRSARRPMALAWQLTDLRT
ncbi:response regulator [Blastopirellula marina]|uniref:Sensor histidine kinase/response regulator n=1 Tax=Blastopirellula marina DSM 3645 TaxID=314230 RepID=A3ZRU6_9BACT|nr:response regulator [Blastopirellula marina]EAQ80865.1 sensor histidine kinase/response regulator [Blastopirellula marina DSM 3645]